MQNCMVQPTRIKYQDMCFLGRQHRKGSTKYRIRDDLLKNSAQNSTFREQKQPNHNLSQTMTTCHKQNGIDIPKQEGLGNPNPLPKQLELAPIAKIPLIHMFFGLNRCYYYLLGPLLSLFCIDFRPSFLVPNRD